MTSLIDILHILTTTEEAVRFDYCKQCLGIFIVNTNLRAIPRTDTLIHRKPLVGY